MLAADVGAAIAPVLSSDTASVSSPLQASTADLDSVTTEHLVIVDSEVEDLGQWKDAIPDNATFVLLHANEDPIAQLTEVMNKHHEIGSMHIISHGADGQLRLAGQTINQEILVQRAKEIQSWNSSFADGADVLIYGCSVAAGDSGVQFVEKLASLIDVDVAASTNATGSATEKYDWKLEHRFGSIQFASLLNQRVLDRVQGHLAIEIWAAGQTSDELMELEINGEVVETWFVRDTDATNGQFLPYVYDVDGISVDDIRINFVNDLYDPDNGVDRNLRIDRIVVDGVTYQTEDPSVFSTGTWLPADGVTAGFRQNEYLTNNGYFQFSSNATGSNGENTIEIDVRGDTGDEDFQLLIDGNVVQTYTDIGTSQRTFSFNTDEAITADRVRIAFINSVYDPQQGVDQNLIVDRIRINGQTFETEAASTFSTGTYVDGQGIIEGNWQSETLHADGYFQFSADDTTQAETSISFESENFIVDENAGVVTLTVIRQGDLSGQSTVNYSVPGGFAIPDQDFRRVNGTLTFNSGESRQSFDVPIINDNRPEGIETFTVALDSPNNAVFGINSTTIVTVNDDDNAPNPPGSLDVQLPEGFTSRLVDPNANFAGPTGLKVADDGRVFVVEKFGNIFVVENGQRIETPFLDLTDEVFSVGTSQGLAGFALDPNFSSNGHVYVLYTASENGVRFGRLERYTVSSSNRNQIDPNSRRILIGTDASNGFPDGGDIHLVGDLQFGNDGSLLISYGDAAPTSDNNAALNAQNLDNLGGVIARVNPQTGQGYESNPFFTGNADDVRSKIWAYGLRNPYRFAVASDGSSNPDDGRPGTLYIGDVQFLDSEEINISRGGENFGWPYFQGNQRVFGNQDPANFTGPEIAFPRSEAQTSIAGAFIEGGNWPGSFQNNYLHADFTAGWIRSYAVNSDGDIVGERDFATGAFGITDLEWDPVSQQLYFVALNQANGFRGELYAISFAESSANEFSPTQVSTGSDGVAFAVTASEEVFRRDGDQWTRIPGSYTNIAVRNANEVWGIDAFGNVSQFNGSSWQSVGGQQLLDIAVSSNGEVWGIGLASNVLRLDGDQWVGVSGTLVDIEIGSDGVVWGTNARNEIYSRANGAWTRVSGALTDISIGSDGSVWGTNAQNQVWRRVGNGWQQQDITLETISANTDTDVWGVDPSGLVYRWNGTEWRIV
jgi:glucose/arabinose dehydrogenase